jgi:RNA polymerase sigma factor (sigma-70 family)
VGWGLSGATLAPGHDRAADEPADSDQRLVAAVRRGDDRAFEVLYERYQRRIHAYVAGMVKDHGRAEDVTQEVFVSALRRMRETEQPLAFKPWLYQIAKNSCIDAFRRSKRTEEVSYDADEGLAPADHSKLVGSGPSPEAAVAAKQELESLCGAFGGLSETHHEILVLRELEGLSYQEIGVRMGMTRPAVESTLFRARRRLTEEYDDIVSGARCLRIQEIIITAAQTRLGTRDTRRLARHLSHCQGCRREALASGLDRSLFTRPSVRERIAKVAGFLPLPAFMRLRRPDAEAVLPPTGRGGWSSQLPLLSDHLSSGWGKAAAGAALLVAGVGAGTGVREVTRSSADRPVPVHSTPAKSSAVASPTPASALLQKAATPRESIKAASTPAPSKKSKSAGKSRSTLQGSGAPTVASGAKPGGGGSVPSASGSNPQSSQSATPTRSGGGQDSGGTAGKPSQPKTPVVSLPATTTDPVKEIQNTVDPTVKETGGAVQEAGQTVDDTVKTVTGDGPVAGAVDRATDTVDKTAGAATDGVKKATDGVIGTVGQITAG